QLYSPLLPWQTRVLRLYPDRGDRDGDRSCEPLVADLIIVNLLSTEGVTVNGTTQVIGYEALSYTWGSPHLTNRMFCNGVAIAITRNLASALHKLRSPTSTRYVWADAICINQHDRQERADQVAKMLHIYQKASSVTAWLG
ncbi:HET-domain-containing protein, partial [Polychaeton citri CBS 116435]